MSTETQNSQTHSKSYDNPTFKTDFKSEEMIEVIKQTSETRSKPERSPLEHQKSYEPGALRTKTIIASDAQIERATKT